MLTRIAFGSCAKQDKEQPIWDAVLASKPDLFIFLGDNIYGDTTDMQVMRANTRSSHQSQDSNACATPRP
ncbi:MAG: hypothetical protein ABW110_07620 [Steroidobacteraceae bacterium]